MVVRGVNPDYPANLKPRLTYLQGCIHARLVSSGLTHFIEISAFCEHKAA
jgi:hypothetical protein